jgi:hypothetical protein
MSLFYIQYLHTLYQFTTLGSVLKVYFNAISKKANIASTEEEF